MSDEVVFRTSRHDGGFHSGRNPDKSAALDLSSWAPRTRAADRDVLPSKDLLDGRILDLHNNDGFVSGVFEHHVNHAVGLGLRLSAKPMWRALGQTEEWAREWSALIEADWKLWAEGESRLADVNRRFKLSTIQAQAKRCFLAHGEIFAVAQSRRNRTGLNTCIRLIDPARVCDPDHPTPGQPDIRGGIEYDDGGHPVAAWIANRHPRDYVSRTKRQDKLEWTRVPFYNRRGRRILFHAYDPMKCDQTRGFSMMSAVIRALKMIDSLSDATLQAALLQTLYALVIKSEMDWGQAMEVLGAGTEIKGLDVLQEFMAQRGEYYSHHNINNRISGSAAKAIHLLPNESLEMPKAGAVNAAIGDMLTVMRQEASRGAGVSLELFTGDFSETSYSASLLSNTETSRGHLGRRHRVMSPFCNWVYGLWLQEKIILEPEFGIAGADFFDVRDALMHAEWIGPPPVDSDPKKSAEASRLRLETGVTTLSHEYALIGMDWEEALEQRARELTKMQDLNLFELEREARMAMAGTPEEVEEEPDEE